MEGSSPHAPWVLLGEAIVAVVRRHGHPLGTLPHGLRSVAGPGIVMAQRFESSPVGPFCELSVLEPARMGARLGWSVTLSVVNHSGARSGGHLNWGFPGEVGALVWESGPTGASMAWGERGIVVRATRHRGALPFYMPLRAFQHRSDGPVVVPIRLRGLAHRARVEIDAPSADVPGPLAAQGPLEGSHVGLVIAGQAVRVDSARHPAGLLHTLVAPHHPPEPGTAQVSLARRQGA